MKGRFCHQPRAVSLLRVALSALLLGGIPLSATIPAIAQDKPLLDVPPVPRQVIGEIVVTGNKTLNSATIIAFSGVKVGDAFTPKTLSDVQTRIYNTGNFGWPNSEPSDAVRVSSQEYNPPNGRIRLLIEVEENPGIKDINVSGSGPVKPEEIKQMISRTPVYNEVSFLRDAQAIQAMYERLGYVAAFSQNTGPDENGILNVDILVTRVAEIKIVGNKKTRRKVILRELQTKENAYYNRNTFFSEDLRRLYNLDIFESITPAESVVGPGRIALTINVVEKRTGNVGVAAGFSSRSQLVGRAEIGDTNFRGTGESVNLLWETGGVANRSSIEFGYVKPWLDNHRTSLGVQLYDKTVYRFSNRLTNATSLGGVGNLGTDSRYNEQRTGATFTLSRPFRKTYRGVVTLRTENVRTDPLALDVANNAAIIQNGPILSVGGNLLHNTRDFDLDPVGGGFQSLNLEVGHANLKAPLDDKGNPVPSAVTGNVNFSKALLDMRQYFSLGGPRKKNKIDEPKPSVALRLMMGTSVGTLPFFEQLFVGGSESLRGYREDRFWGKHMMLGSVEVRYPMARSLKGVLFLDVGHAWGGPYSGVSIEGFKQSGFNPRAGIGMGIRVRTPIGPLSLDYGFGSEGGRTHFSFANTF